MAPKAFTIFLCLQTKLRFISFEIQHLLCVLTLSYNLLQLLSVFTVSPKKFLLSLNNVVFIENVVMLLSGSVTLNP